MIISIFVTKALTSSDYIQVSRQFGKPQKKNVIIIC